MNPYEAAAAILLAESGCTVRSWRKGNTGRAYKDAAWSISVPVPRGPISFGVFAHEIAHQVLHRQNNLPRWLEEVEAEDYALAQFERFNLKGAERYRINAAKHLGYAFSKAMRRSKDRLAMAQTILDRAPEWWLLAEEHCD